MNKLITKLYRLVGSKPCDKNIKQHTLYFDNHTGIVPTDVQENFRLPQ